MRTEAQQWRSGAANSRLRAQINAFFGRRRRLKARAPSTKNFSHYELLKEIGAGARGTVYLARDQRSHRLAALKVLRAFTDRESRQRFSREAACVAAIAHPNVVRFYEVVHDRGIPAIAMEYVPGRTLDRLIPKRGLALETCLDYATQIASALAAIHRVGMIDRDLKPGNLVVTKGGKVIWLDFGLAKIIGRQRQSCRRIPHVRETREGTIQGTVEYMSPEQVQGRAVDQRSDVFSFGSLFYEMLTGRRPFHRGSEIDTMRAILHKAPPKLPARIPPAVRRIVRRCLAKNPDSRYANATDVLQALLYSAKSL